MPTKEECFYMAAVLDTEGWVGIGKKRDGYYPRINVSQTTYSWLESIQCLWGGAIYKQTPRRIDNPDKRAPEWQWMIHGDGLISLLKAVRPYLKLKREQADLCLEFQLRITRGLGTRGADGRWAAPTPQERKIRHDLYKRCKLLNQTGPRNEQLVLEMKTEAQLPLVIK